MPEARPLGTVGSGQEGGRRRVEGQVRQAAGGGGEEDGAAPHAADGRGLRGVGAAVTSSSSFSSPFLFLHPLLVFFFFFFFFVWTAQLVGVKTGHPVGTYQALDVNLHNYRDRRLDMALERYPKI